MSVFACVLTKLAIKGTAAAAKTGVLGKKVEPFGRDSTSKVFFFFSER